MQMDGKQKILIVTGEASGDRHTAEMVKELQVLNPNLEFYGIGGDALQERGMHLLFHIRQMAFLGFVEVVKHLPFIWQVYRRLKNWMKTENSQAVILVDYPGFNLRLAKLAKNLGIPVIYYISPQLWAWGEKRVEKIRRYVDLLLVIFQFEVEFYRKHGITAHFVGHPLVEEVDIRLSEEEFRRKHHLDPEKPIVALLPGSRSLEVKSLLPPMVEASLQFAESDKVEWCVGVASSIDKRLFSEMLGKTNHLRLIRNDTHHLLRYAHVALLASGTATLETGLLQTPMVVLYKILPLTYLIGKRMIKIPYISLANIVLGKKVVPEFIQDQVTAANILAELNRYFYDADHYQSIVKELAKIREILGPPGASHKAARKIMDFLTT
ncbi:MAG: lipid-A-disaccharide synthase [Calditrichia bacterium]